ncbi:MAG: transglutaminase-like enzyme, putative cysteine protease [halophilic archaeon J07HX64]|jgi:Transglutaminase-like enzymes, putative cysteine proteases|nr:MAG: transglutaminase-like enzyme, putative cysteine protease [halophilic archaeon J07HX64]
MSLAPGDRLSTGIGSLSAVPDTVGRERAVRAGTLLSTLVLVWTFTLVVDDVVATVGNPTAFRLVVVGSLVAATVVWPVVRLKRAMRAGAAVFAVGLLLYGFFVPAALRPSVALSGTLDLVTGRSALWIVRVELWALLVTPVPVFLTWLLALRRRYVYAATVGGGSLCFLVLSGDAGLSVTLLGVVAAGGVVGLGDVMRRAHSVTVVESLVVVLAVMIVAPFVFSVVPGGAAGPLGTLGDSTITMEENVVGADGDLDIVGSIEQNPDVRFVVDGERYWRTGSYDRYTGDGWIRSGSPGQDGSLASPGDAEVASYQIEARSTLAAVPAPWQPVGLDGIDGASVAPDGSPELDGTLGAGETYTVESTVPDVSLSALAGADGDYPQEVTERYTQLPASTSDRVAERTREIAVDAETPYETAVVVERWLESNRAYSLDIDRPSGDIVESFLFEMDQGYCTYYATAMIGMLRSVDVPARLVVGYTPGEPVEDGDGYAVRGTNSHAWVEVYIPEHGWVQFDPTPADPRTDAEQQVVTGPSTATDTNVSAPGSELGGPDDGDSGGSPAGDNSSGASGNGSVGSSQAIGSDEQVIDITRGLNTSDNESVTPPENEGTDRSDTDEGDDGSAGVISGSDLSVDPGEISPQSGRDALLELPGYQHVLLAALAVAGLAVGVRRSPLPNVVGRETRIRLQRRVDPGTDIERAHERLLLVLAKRHRPRDDGETTRQYLRAVDAGPEARRLARIRERARFAGERSEAAADEAVELVEQVRKR